MARLTKKEYKSRENLEDWLNREEEKRILGERNLPINEMDNITPIYDTDDLPFEKDLALSNVEGMTAKPSIATLLKAMKKIPLHEFTYEDLEEIPQEEPTAMGFYPLNGRKPFIDWSNREPDGELTYTNKDEFAFAVATRVWLDYKLGNKTNLTNSDIEDKLFEDPKRKRYKLPDKFLAMDVILCAKYCRDSFEGYLSNNRQAAYHMIEASKIRYFQFDRETTVQNKIKALEKRKEEIML